MGDQKIVPARVSVTLVIIVLFRPTVQHLLRLSDVTLMQEMNGAMAL
jgi:hypothetical protein